MEREMENEVGTSSTRTLAGRPRAARRRPRPRVWVGGRGWRRTCSVHSKPCPIVSRRRRAPAAGAWALHSLDQYVDLR